MSIRAAHKPINQWSHALVIEDRAELEDNLRRACSYEEWKTAAAALDRIKETEKNWSDDDESTIYDFRLIRHRRESLQKALAVKDISELIYLMRSGLLRNLGGLNEIQLYSHLYLKTKRLIEDYHNEVVLSLQEILNCPPSQQRENFISDTRQSFGSTALVLRGGATFSLTHLGVAKALFEQSLLPRIITGSSISALVAALICIRTDDELPAVLDGSGINLSVFEKKRNGAYQRKVFRWLETGFILDPDVFTKFVQVNIGDMTFEEAFQKTRRILNITVNSRRKNEVPRLLNYLTAPTVLIRTAACASASSLGIFLSTDLQAKMNDGTIVNWGSHDVKWDHTTGDTSDDAESRLAQLFNVNHFIVSQSSPFTSPFLPKGPQQRKSTIFDTVMNFLFGEIRHRINQFGHFGFLPQAVTDLFSPKMLGHVTISPLLSGRDLKEIFSNPTQENISHWVLKGEKSTWPYITLIRNRMMVELALDRARRVVELESKAGSNRESGDERVWGEQRRLSLTEQLD